MRCPNKIKPINRLFYSLIFLLSSATFSSAQMLAYKIALGDMDISRLRITKSDTSLLQNGHLLVVKEEADGNDATKTGLVSQLADKKLPISVVYFDRQHQISGLCINTVGDNTGMNDILPYLEFYLDGKFIFRMEYAEDKLYQKRSKYKTTIKYDSKGYISSITIFYFFRKKTIQLNRFGQII
jgi:hypothetical protein